MKLTPSLLLIAACAHPPVSTPALAVAAPDAPVAAAVERACASEPAYVVDADETFRTPMRPAPLAIECLPVFEVPPPLAEEEPPAALPSPVISVGLRLGYTIERAQSQGALAPGSVMATFEAPYGRVQLANGAVYVPGSFLVYETAELESARAETLSVAGGKPVHRIVDAWMSTSSRAVAAVRETLVEPRPVLGGLMMAYVLAGEVPTLVLLLPSVSGFAVTHIRLDGSGETEVSQRVKRADLARWYEATGQTMPEVALGHIGAELAPVRDGEAPRVLAYATLQRQPQEEQP